MNSLIGYSGRVKARLSVHNSNGFYFKNSGKKPLWNLLAKAITNNSFSELLPTNIGIYQRGSGGDDISLLYRPLPLQGKTWGDAVDNDVNSTSVLFTSTATHSNKKRDASGDVVLKLLTESGEVLAEVEDIDDILRDIHNAMIPGIDAIYEWQLKFTNTSYSE